MGSACSESQIDPVSAPQSTWGSQARIPGEYVVTLASGITDDAIRELYGRFGIKDIKNLGNGVYLLTVVNDPGPEVMESLGGRSAAIKAVQPNFVYQISPRGKAQ